MCLLVSFKFSICVISFVNACSLNITSVSPAAPAPNMARSILPSILPPLFTAHRFLRPNLRRATKSSFLFCRFVECMHDTWTTSRFRHRQPLSPFQAISAPLLFPSHPITSSPITFPIPCQPPQIFSLHHTRKPPHTFPRVLNRPSRILLHPAPPKIDLHQPLRSLFSTQRLHPRRRQPQTILRFQTLQTIDHS